MKYNKLLNNLRTEWPSTYALQPKTADERKNVIQIQDIKKAAANEIDRLRSWIKDEGERNNTCTYNVLNEVCAYCQCNKKPI